MGFLRKQEERLAVRLLEWQYQRINAKVPPKKAIEKSAEELVEKAHRIARERGKNVMGILKELINDFKK